MPQLTWLKRGLTLFLVLLANLAWNTGPVTSFNTNPVQPLISPEQAIALAVNDWNKIDTGYELHHPHYTVTFTAERVTFAPRQNGPGWQWQFSGAMAGPTPLATVDTDLVQPHQESNVISYSRGGLVEQYIAQTSTIKQQLLIPQPLALEGADLVITGYLVSTGTIKTKSESWSWGLDETGGASGRIRILDAQGLEIPARLKMLEESVQLTIGGSTLAAASYPITVESEIGNNDSRISDMGPNSNANFDAVHPAVAYNSTANEYLVVWYGDDNSTTLRDDEFEIFGQRLSATTGDEVGANDFRISDMGPDGDPNSGAFHPAVAYNNIANEYLVIWFGDDNTGTLADNKFEIFGQRLNASGIQIGTNDFRLSDMGPDGDPNFGAGYSAVVYNSTANEYLIVWQGVDNISPLVVGEVEIFGQRLNATTGAEVGANDFRISDMGPNGNPNFGAHVPVIAYNNTANEYLVVWFGDDNIGGLVDGEAEIFGQRLNASGTQIGANDFRISDMGPDGDPNFIGGFPAVAYNSLANEYLVVWYGDDNTGTLVEGEGEIFGQRLNAVGQQVGANDFRISDMGPDGNVNFGASDPTVSYNGTNNEYLVTWWGGDNTGVLVNNEAEIFGQRLNATTGAEVGANDFRISDMGPDGNPNFGAFVPAIAYNNTANEYLVVWFGDDNIGGLVDDEAEIFGQRLNTQLQPNTPNWKVFLPVVTRNN